MAYLKVASDCSTRTIQLETNEYIKFHLNLFKRNFTDPLVCIRSLPNSYSLLDFLRNLIGSFFFLAFLKSAASREELIHVRAFTLLGEDAYAVRCSSVA
jgi:hypothetical protein